jgi:hypothetical protein
MKISLASCSVSSSLSSCVVLTNNKRMRDEEAAFAAEVLLTISVFLTQFL